MLGPVIEGERTRLEPPRPEFLPSYVRWFSDPEITRYLLYRYPLTDKGEAEWLERTATDEHKVLWSIVARTSGRLVGNTALDHIDWRNRHAMSGTVIGEKDEWGKGYATESMRLRTRYAFRELGLQKVITTVIGPNDASRRGWSGWATGSVACIGATSWRTGRGTMSGSGRFCGTTGKLRRGAHEAAAASNAL